jgi:hypothetical protein
VWQRTPKHVPGQFHVAAMIVPEPSLFGFLNRAREKLVSFSFLRFVSFVFSVLFLSS